MKYRDLEAGNRDLEAGAKAIANDFRLPGGRRKKLSRVIADHLAWFDMAEARGMTWDDMIVALTAAGVTRENGRPLSIGTLSSAVWRKNQMQTTAPARADRSAKPRRAAPAQNSPSRPARLPGRATAPVQRLKEAGSPNAAVLAFMQRAAKIRRRTDDE